MAKTSEDKTNFRQYLLTKQIVECAANIDKQIDIEINKLQNKMRDNLKNSSKRKRLRKNSAAKIKNTFIINNKGSILEQNNYSSFKEEDNKKNIVVELQSVKDFYSMLEKIKNTIEYIIKNKDSGSQ